MSRDELDFVAKVIGRATSFVDVFGALPKGSSIDDQHAYLRKKYTDLARFTHPDKVEDKLKDHASKIFNEITELRVKADNAIAHGTYEAKFSSVDKPAAAPTKPAAFTSVRSAYFLVEDKPIFTGERSVIYGATSALKEDVLLRIVLSPMHNPWFANERVFLKTAFDPKDGRLFPKVRKYFPEVIDLFYITDKKRKYQAVVYPRKRGLISVADLGNLHADKLDIQHIAWISRRIMAQAVAANACGLSHGAITPEHVLVDPIAREPLHIGWQHSVPLGQPSTSRPKNFEELLNPCGMSEEKDDTQAAIQTILWLRSKLAKPEEFPDKIENIFKYKGIHKKYGLIPALDILTEMTKEYRSKWGVNYRPLEV